MRFAERMKNLGTETAFEVLAKAKALEAEGKEVIHLEIGEPDFDTPKNIKEAAVKALNEGYTHYTPSAGLMEAREAVAKYVSQTRGIEVSPTEVVITPGAKPIMFFAIIALVDPGDEVVYPNPAYPIYESVVNLVGGKPVPIHLREENDFRLDADELKAAITPKTKMIIINSPHNPTGGILTKEDLETIANLAQEHDLWVLSDEIYSRIIYSGDHISIASLPDMKERTILLDGFSKTYAMTGWRIGYGVMEESLSAKIARLMTNCNSCTAAFTQVAGIEALFGPQHDVEKMVAEFKRRRDVIVEGLNSIQGISCKLPQGAFYAFPNITSIGWNCKRLSDSLLQEAGVAVLPGTSFGIYGDGYLRLSYANSVENIKKGLERIKDFMAKI